MLGKKPSQKAVQTIYIDSCFVDAYLWGDRDMKQHTKRVFYRIRNSSPVKVIIPFVSVGEIVNTMIQKEKEDKVGDLLKLLKDLIADTPPPNKRVIELSSRILSDDNLFDTTDAIIAAHAISDEYSTRLLTTDTNMQNSRVLSELEAKLRDEEKRNYKLRITDEF
jgi:predicted nucleic acid-binding protein